MPPKTKGTFTKPFSTSGPNLVILAEWVMSYCPGKLKNGVNSDFEVKFDLAGQGQLPPKTIGTLNQGLLHLWSKFGDPSLNGSRVIARTSYRADKQVIDTQRDRHTHTHRRR